MTPSAFGPAVDQQRDTWEAMRRDTADLLAALKAQALRPRPCGWCGAISAHQVWCVSRMYQGEMLAMAREQD